MTGERRFDQDLSDLLADLYLRPAPDYRDDILQRVARTPQRQAWTFFERWLPMGVTTLARQTLRPFPWRTIGLLAIVALLIAGLVAVYVGTPTPLPAPFGPARNGLLAFESQGDIVVLDQATGSRTTIVDGPTIDAAPAFSRDGTRLAFLRHAEGRMALWVSDVRGQNLRELASGIVAYAFEAGPNPAAWMEWSPDGHSILLSTPGAAGRAITIVSTVEGGGVRTLNIPHAEGPTWRPPDGNEILFRKMEQDGFGLFAVRADGTGLRTVIPATGDAEFDALFFGWSTDGQKIAYQWVDPSGPRLVFVAGADGSDPQPITTAESVGAAWSPDGTKVAFLDGSDPGGVITLNVVGSDGSGLLKLPGSKSGVARWTPDGKGIVLLPDGAASPVLLDPAGGPAQPMLSISGGLPDWQRLAP